MLVKQLCILNRYLISTNFTVLGNINEKNILNYWHTIEFIYNRVQNKLFDNLH